MKYWNKIKYRFIKDAILVILILLHEKVVKFCLIVFLINFRFSKVEGGISPPQSLKKGGSAPKRPPTSTALPEANAIDPQQRRGNLVNL